MLRKSAACLLSLTEGRWSRGSERRLRNPTCCRPAELEMPSRRSRQPSALRPRAELLATAAWLLPVTTPRVLALKTRRDFHKHMWFHIKASNGRAAEQIGAGGGAELCNGASKASSAPERLLPGTLVLGPLWLSSIF